MSKVNAPPIDQVFSVTQLNQQAKRLLESNLGVIWICGEISNLSQPSSGHCYFSLKDKNAQVRCACFKIIKQNLNFKLSNGLQVIMRARVSLYPSRGDYQLIAQAMLAAGDGLLQLQFQQLKKECEEKGWFSSDLKKEVPKKINTIGIVTSATGAAIKDVLKVLKRRSPTLSIIIYPTLVQGSTASKKIAQSIEQANQRNECDLLLISRGGGSLEDLWCFNTIKVAEAIINSQLPTITGIGHETDTTIADLVADYRAATPSAAAEIASTDQRLLKAQLSQQWQRISSLINQQYQWEKQRFQQLIKRLRHPQQQLKEKAQTLDHLEARLLQHMQSQIKLHRTKLNGFGKHLHSLSPLSTLERGYTMTEDKNHNVISSILEIEKDQLIHVRFHDGNLQAIVKKTRQQKDTK
jgi:exodeoxyribonuclease VII large subunit